MKEKVIKFRAWCESIKKLCNVMAIDFENEKVHIEIKNDFGCYAIGVKSDEVILEQYTGLKDKNGKEIYEGDLVTMIGCIFKIIFLKEKCAYKMEYTQFKYNDPLELTQAKTPAIEVVGNINENGDLLG